MLFDKEDICTIKKGNFPFSQKAHMQIYYPQLLFPSPIMLHVSLDVQALIAWLDIFL